jgi:uncharacterized protein YaiE (UPF0345 family)
MDSGFHYRQIYAGTGNFSPQLLQKPATGYHAGPEVFRVFRHLNRISMLKHNSYFNGAVQSIGFERNGLRATVGVIEAGEQRHFNTAAAERMTVVSGLLRANIGGTWNTFAAGTYFEVVANSGFDVQAMGGPAAYLCEFLG